MTTASRELELLVARIQTQIHAIFVTIDHTRPPITTRAPETIPIAWIGFFSTSKNQTVKCWTGVMTFMSIEDTRTSVVHIDVKSVEDAKISQMGPLSVKISDGGP